MADLLPQRFGQLAEYIDRHLDEPLTLTQLSAQVCLSRFHFHRQFSAAFGLSLGDYIKQLRFKRAAHALVYRPQRQVLDIALEAGYDSGEAFARAFKQFSGQSPSQFRAAPNWEHWQQQDRQLNQLRQKLMNAKPDYAVTIADFPRTAIGLLIHRGAPARLGQTLQRFIAWRKTHGLSPRVSRTFNLLYDDPASTPPAEFRLGLGAEIKGPLPGGDVLLPLPGGEVLIEAGEIPAGRVARLCITGGDEQLEPALDYLYRDWLPASGENLRDFPLFLERIRFFPDVPAAEAELAIYLPLENRH